ncbi:MAG TPA: ATP-binding protein [Herpetosiphonaceae bacterium]
MTSRPPAGRARQFAALRRQHRRLLALNRLAAALSALSDPAQLVEQLAAGLLPSLGAAGAIIWLYNPASRRYGIANVATAASAASLDEEREVLGGLQVRSGEGLAGQVVSEGAGRLAADAEAYRAAFGNLGRRRESLFGRLRTLLPAQFNVAAVPLRAGGKALGVIELVFERGGLGADDMEWLQPFTDQCANLLSLARVQAEASRQRRRLAALDAVVTAISTASDLPDLLHVTLLVLIEVVGASGGAICLVSPGEQGVLLAASANMPESEALILVSPLAKSLLEDVIYYGQPNLRPIQADQEPAEGEELWGRAAIPLLAGGTVVGVLLLYARLGALSSSVDWPTLVSVGSQIGIAVANTRLYEESQRERRRLGAVIASIADGVVICNGAGELILANEAAAAMLGLASLPTSARVYQARTPEGAEVTTAEMPLNRALAGERFHDYQLVMRSASDQDLVLSFSGAPLRGSSLGAAQGVPSESERDGAVVVFRDVTAQRRLDEAKDEFLAVAAHELRSPLAAIKGYSDLMLRRELRNTRGDTRGDNRDLRGHQTLNQQVNVLVQLVDNLLDISRLDAGRFVLQLESVDLGPLVDSVALQVRSSAPNHTVLTEQAAAPIHVLADAIRLRQVVTNLLTNAVRYSPVDTTVRVRVTTDGEHGLVIVDDEGPGIPAAHRDRLFERYYRVPGIKRTGSSTEGLGLGLYLCREIITLHGGKIWVDSAPGNPAGGARFQVALPLYHPEAESESGQRSIFDLSDELLDRAGGI